MNFCHIREYITTFHIRNWKKDALRVVVECLLLALSNEERKETSFAGFFFIFCQLWASWSIPYCKCKSEFNHFLPKTNELKFNSTHSIGDFLINFLFSSVNTGYIWSKILNQTNVYYSQGAINVLLDPHLPGTPILNFYAQVPRPTHDWIKFLFHTLLPGALKLNVYCHVYVKPGGINRTFHHVSYRTSKNITCTLIGRKSLPIAVVCCSLRSPQREVVIYVSRLFNTFKTLMIRVLYN